MNVVEANEVTDEIVGAFTRLIPQLSRKSRIPSASELGEIVSSDASTLLLAYDGDRIVGSLTLVMFRIPTGLRAWIEDVVVDAAARRQGVAEALNCEALRRATEAGARTLSSARVLLVKQPSGSIRSSVLGNETPTSIASSQQVTLERSTAACT